MVAETKALATTDAAGILERVITAGDLSRLSPADRVRYYAEVCASVGLNPLTKPFEYLSLNGKLVLYATKGCTDQLRSVKGISIDRMEREEADDLCVWTAYGHDSSGRTDSEVGAVPIAGLKGEAKANAVMKASTKAKRRLTLSLAGLGWLDESEVSSIPSAQRTDVDMETGEVREPRTLAATIAERRAALTTSAPPITGVDGVQAATLPPSSGAVAATTSSEPRAGDTDAPALTAGELRDWLRGEMIGVSEAREAAMALFGLDSFDKGMSDGQRATLRAHLQTRKAAGE